MTPVADIVPCTVLVFTDSEHRFLRLSRQGRGEHRVQVLRGGMWSEFGTLPTESDLMPLSQRALGLSSGRFVLLPPVAFRSPRPLWIALWMGAGVVVTVLLALLSQAPVVLLPGLLVSLIGLPLGGYCLSNRGHPWPIWPTRPSELNRQRRCQAPHRRAWFCQHLGPHPSGSPCPRLVGVLHPKARLSQPTIPTGYPVAYCGAAARWGITPWGITRWNHPKRGRARHGPLARVGPRWRPGRPYGTH